LAAIVISGWAVVHVTNALRFISFVIFHLATPQADVNKQTNKQTRFIRVAPSLLTRPFIQACMCVVHDRTQGATILEMATGTSFTPTSQPTWHPTPLPRSASFCLVARRQCECSHCLNLSVFDSSCDCSTLRVRRSAAPCSTLLFSHDWCYICAVSAPT